MKLKTIAITTLASAIISSGIAYGESYEITPLIGGVWKEGNLALDDEFLVGAELMWQKKFFNMQPEVTLLFSPDVDYDTGGDSTGFTRFMVNGVYDLTDSGNIIPFIKGGLGYEHMGTRNFDNANSPFADAGAGLKYQLTDKLALKAETIYMLKYNDSRWDNNLAVLAGLTFSFGGSSPAQEVKPVIRQQEPLKVVKSEIDSDGDGVLDSEDKCPETPAGAPVDGNGCALDSDSDGIIDLNDKCPDTPAGAQVNASGCVLDIDGDGVPDHLDKCPTTPTGAPVDSNGCALDSDSDGIIDLNDKCSDTPAGAQVNASGCVLDNDADGDGVTDNLDQCPETEQGLAVDVNGCPESLNLAITFANDSAQIIESASSELGRYAEFLQRNPAYNVTIVGHTDSNGSDSYNQYLSEQRAEAVKLWLIKYGIAASRLHSFGMGEKEPVADNSTAAGRKQNRRIEAQLRLMQ